MARYRDTRNQGLPPKMLLTVLLLALGNETEAEILTPPYFNLAEGKEIVASATCGVDTPDPELYCQLVGANSDQEAATNLNQTIIQGQQCDYCDPDDEEKRHPPEYAVDGMETWWQSPPLSRGKEYEQVDLTINLGQEFHVAYVYVRMGNSPRPGMWKLEKSKDHGMTWSPWQYFAESDSDCVSHFGIRSHTPITRDDTVICTTEYSKIVPLEGGEIPISILNNRPSAKHYFNSSVLQEWTRATNVRFSFMKTKNLLGHLMSVRRQDPTVTRRYFYSIKDISIGGRCMCNGHANTCDSKPSNPKELLCQCQHHTCGPQCATCCEGYQQKKWRQSTYSKLFVCEPCNCFGHSDKCVYDAEVDKEHRSLDVSGKYEGGGVCQDCKHFTEGINCDRCKPKFYRPSNKPLNATDVCQPCNCELFYSTGNCMEGTGQCECRPEFTAPNCDSCSYGYFGFPNCRPCECNLNGTEGYHCQADEGACPCKQNFAGHYCDICAEGYYSFPDCLACQCNHPGSLSDICEVETGNCECESNFGGRSCDVCHDGFYNYPICSYCDCDERGTEASICDKGTGQCMCKQGYGGPRCDQCAPGYFGHPKCEPCNCSKNGSSSISCDATGKCSCLSNFVSRTCNQCAPGYYNYPECTECNCDSHGSIGVSCDLEGKCQCHDNFDGDRCDKCKDNFYNFPTCEGCNCDPAGIAGTFQGCGSLPIGELCQCKDRVQGRICNQCKELFWNLQANNPDGCEDCRCNIPGVIGSIGECDGKSGQCICKPSVTGRDCSMCLDGKYNLQESNLFGCSECHCDIGGSLSTTCDKDSGACPCRSRIEGQRCDQPMRTHYFPTLHQLQYEAEDGRTPNNRSVRYGFAEDLFPGYSWKGYAVFSPLQNKITREVDVQKSSVYRVVLRYVNPNEEPVHGTVTITPEIHTEVEQSSRVLFKPGGKPSRPAFVTVAGFQGSSPAVMEPGRWTVSIAIDKSLFLDYFVLLPADYYEASILTQEVSQPCTVGYKGLCRHYAYPSLASFNSARAGDDSLGVYLDDQDTLDEIGETRLPLVDQRQNKIGLELRVSNPGPHVLLVMYVSPTDAPDNHTSTLLVETNSADKGKVTLYPCKFTSVCRQVVTEANGKVAVVDLPSETASILLDGGADSHVALKSVVAIPAQEWSVDYLYPRSVCVRKDGRCVQGIFPETPNAKKIELEQNNQILEVASTPHGVYDNSSKFIYLNDKDATIDVPAKVARAGVYVFVVQYYQPDFPDFNIDVLVQNGKHYEAKVPMAHCPSNAGCRSLVRQVDGNTRFQLSENFVITLKDTGKGIWLDYILVIPADQYSDEYLKKKQFDQTKEFINKCGTNHFHIDSAEEGFCRDSVFSLTSHYNSGALPCGCDSDGSRDFDCEKFGGQCHCKPNVIGRRCNMCKTGYFGFPDCSPCNCPSTAVCESERGRCICPDNVRGERCDECEPGTYGYDPILGCEQCECSPEGVLGGDVQCDLFSGRCSCKPNVIGRQCDECAAGHYGFPRCDKCDCDARGTRPDVCDKLSADCLCKANVHGAACDLCKEGMFNLQLSNDAGCSECFCFGKTSRCSSASQLYRSRLSAMATWRAVVQVKGSERDESFEPAPGLAQPRQLNETHVLLDMGAKDDASDQRSGTDEASVVYLAAPTAYLGKRLASYGGWLNYSLYYTTGPFGQAVLAPDVVLQGADGTLLMHRAEEQPSSLEIFPASVQLVESNFETKQNLRATREQLMVVLGDLRGIYIRAIHWEPTLTIVLSYVTLDVATETYAPNAELASSVEQCQCPPNYSGLSCEECAKGYYRVPEGPYGGYCVKCECNHHADACDVNTGICFDCKNGTTGDHCEMCQEGYYGDATQGTPSDCLICACPLPVPSNNFARGCNVSEDNSMMSCDCLPGYYGALCEACAAGFYGQPEIEGETCKPCECSGNIDTNEIGSCDSVSGECVRCLNNTYGSACNLCAPGFFGDAVERKDCRSCFCDKCGMERCDSYNGVCECRENVVGESCDRCAEFHYGFDSCEGCRPCNCGIASNSSQCADKDGRCACKPGVEGRACDRCMVGFWNYGPEGCQSCGCTKGYSHGTSCNATTGQCECLPGVEGEKCDHCPERTVLDERQGCLTCDKCTHDLLDVTDDLEALLDPVASSFENVTDSYLTNQRLDFINDTVNELSPKVKLLDPRRVVLDPLKQDIAKLGDKAFALRRRIEILKLAGNEWNSGAEESLKNTSDFRRSVSNEIMLVNNIVNKVQSLATDTEIEAGPKIDSALAEAQDTLNEIEKVLFTAVRDKANDYRDQANILISKIPEYEEPVNGLEQSVIGVGDGARKLTSQIDDVNNLMQQAGERATAAERLSTENRQLVNEIGFNDIKIEQDLTAERLAKAAQLNAEARELLHQGELNLSSYGNEVFPDEPVDENQKLSELVDKNANLLNDLEGEVLRAAGHAQALESESQRLEQVLTKTRNLTGVRAASAYQGITNDITLAEEYAKDAYKSANNATNSADGLPSRSELSYERSENLLRDAGSTLAKPRRDLRSILDDGNDLANIAKQNVKNNETLNIIERALEDLSIESSSVMNQTALNNADRAEFAIQDAINNLVKGNADRIPEDLKTTRQLSKDIFDSNRETNQASNQLEAIDLPSISEKLSFLSERQQQINRTGNSLYDKIEDLKQKIMNARELVNTVRIGLTFFPNTTLELKNPESLPLQTTSTKISFYFRTPMKNGFLLYLGNERTNTLRAKSHDFMAIYIEGGYPVLILDLGSGPQKIVGNRVVSDDKWRQLIVDRTGRNIKLIIREDAGDGQANNFESEQPVPGSHSIFNLDQERSKLFVGGYPQSFQMQDGVVWSSFEGEMEELMIGDVPVSLWNFVSGENNWKPAFERDRLVNLQSPTGYRFEREGFAVLNKQALQLPPDRKQFRVQFKFKTWASNGLMYLMGGQRHHFAVELKDGHVRFHFDLGDGELAVETPEKHNDGQWHTVEAFRVGDMGALRLDGAQIDINSSGDKERLLDSTVYVYFGGYPASVPNPYRITPVGFEGCIDDVSIQEITVDLTKNAKASGVVPGCPVKFASLVSFDSVHPGYVKWEHVDVPGWLQVSLKFRTSAESGLIYKLVDADGSVASSLALEAGQLVLSSGGQGEQLRSSGNGGIRFADNGWHVITATHNGTLLRLDIDDSLAESSESATPVSAIAGASLYVGGAPTPGAAAPFAGCIGDATINGAIVNFANATERPHAHLSICNGPDQPTLPEEEAGGIATHPPPPHSPDLNESTTNVDDLSNGGDGYEEPTGTIEGRGKDSGSGEAQTETAATVNPLTSTSAPETIDGCRLPLYPAPDPDQFSENAWRFGTQADSRFEYSTLNGRHKDDFDFQIDLKTSANEGIIFYASGTNTRDLIALYIKDGLVHFTYDCGSGPALLVGQKKVNDLQWHTVYFKRVGIEGDLLVDDDTTIHGQSQGNTESIAVQPPFYVGGVDPTKSAAVFDSIGVNKTFSGCIRNFMLNGQHVGEPVVREGIIPCSKRVEPGMFFYPGNGSNWFKADDKFVGGKQMEIQMDIKPRKSTGLLLYISGKNDYVVLEMVNGTVKFLVKTIRGQIETSFDATSPNALCDGNWHNIQAIKRKNAVIVSIDHKAAPPGIINKNLGNGNVKHQIYIGGHPSLHSGKGLKGSESKAQYVGCINNIVIKDHAYTLDPAHTHGKVIADVCPTT
ncbi:hypothetical protein QAD02_010398 [Eretmocerus hayati]|uniref:Uncharacterized protein n=1 Tax=Eretmocerus hayati TaxID=131215 RepID=A0ACC2NC40_9HYME|nr:hypothetical protein QAD02_010398 [Eretmocerus hayati]